MNLILLFDPDFTSPNHVRLSGRRLAHMQDILKAQGGQSFIVGKANGQMGEGRVTEVGADSIELDVALTQSPPAPLPLTLIIPMVRPPMFKRLLFHATTFGVKKIFVLNFKRVDQGLWNSNSLRPEEIQGQLILGLEQAKDTVLPEVIIKNRFKPFVEDELPAMAEGTLKMVAHPGGGKPIKAQGAPVTLVIGPEGGLVDFEVQKFKELGFQTMDLGPRILRVESALPYLIGHLWG